MDIFNIDNPPLFELEPLWPLDVDTMNIYGAHDLTDIIFDPDTDFKHHALLLPSAGSAKCSSPGSLCYSDLPQADTFFTDHPSGFIKNMVGTDLREDMGSSSSSSSYCSSHLSPFPSSATHPSPCSVHNTKSETELFHSEERGSFQMTERQTPAEEQSKRRRLDFRHMCNYKPDPVDVVQVKEMIYRSAVMRTINFGPEQLPKKPERRNVKMSREPQTIAARRRRERLSERLRVLQRLVPGGSRMDTANMLHEAANYLKYLKSQLSNMEVPAFLSSMRVDSAWER